ncbi:class I SAM-dependent methyltransferase [Intestinibacter sp.]
MKDNCINKNQGDIMKQTTVKYFNNTAEDYDNSHDGKFVNCMYQEIIHRVRNLKGEKILDLGCGNGNIISMLKKEREASYYGLDISENMIKEAKKKCGEDVNFTVGDAESLPYSDNQFDIIICNASFHHYTKPEVSVKEIGRVLKKAGTLVLGDPTIPWPIRPLFNKMLPYSNSGDFKLWAKKDIVPMFETWGFEVNNWKRINYRTFIFNAKKK